MRSKYLGILSHVCHLSARDVDNTAWLDFLTYCATCDAWIKGHETKE